MYKNTYRKFWKNSYEFSKNYELISNKKLWLFIEISMTLLIRLNSCYCTKQISQFFFCRNSNKFKMIFFELKKFKKKFKKYFQNEKCTKKRMENLKKFI